MECNETDVFTFSVNYKAGMSIMSHLSNVKFPVQFRSCPACGTDSFTKYATGKDWNAGRCANEWILVQCRACSLIYLNPVPAPEALPLIYGKEYGTHHLNETLNSTLVRIRLALRRRRMKWMVPLLPPDSRLLEAGCGEGFQACLYRQLCPEWVVEASDFSVPHLEELVSRGIIVTEGDYDRLTFSKSFDFISLCDVLEHVPNQSFTVKKIASDLTEGGYLYLELPNPQTLLARFLPSTAGINMFPEHTAFFTGQQITALLDKNGFDVMWIKKQSSPGAIYATGVALIRKYLSETIELRPTVGPMTIGPCYALEWILSLLGMGHGLTLLARKR
jgi:SAM-dependent methyltransferase